MACGGRRDSVKPRMHLIRSMQDRDARVARFAAARYGLTREVSVDDVALIVERRMCVPTPTSLLACG